MSAAELLADVARLGIKLEPHGDRLRYCPRSAVTPDLAERLAAHKAELLAMLQTNAPTHREAPEPIPVASSPPAVDSAPRCPRCGFRGSVDVPIHDGQSNPARCAKCSRFLEFPDLVRPRETITKLANKQMNQSAPIYWLHVRPLPQADDPQGVRRLRGALKSLLRSCRLRCAAVQSNPPGAMRHDAPGSVRKEPQGAKHRRRSRAASER